MILMQMARAQVSSPAIASFDRLVDGFPQEFRRLIGPTLASQAEVLGVEPSALVRGPHQLNPFEAPSQPAPLKAEVFSDGTNLYVLSLTEKTRSAAYRQSPEAPADVPLTLTAYCLSSELDSLGWKTIERATNEGFGVQLRAYRYTSKKFEELKKEGRIAPKVPSEAELTAANALRDRAARSLAVAIKASGGLLVKDLPKQVSDDLRARTTEAQVTLREAGLIDTETVVICTKTQAQTARAPSREVLEDLAARGLKCACGRSVVEERIEEAVTISDLGRSLLEKSRWLTLLVLHELDRVGVPIQDTLAEEQSGGDELDLLADISGELVLFELKDKEFNLGEAYSFGAKIGIIAPDHAVVVSTGHVGNDAKDHFERARLARRASVPDVLFERERKTDIRYIEGIDALSAGITTVASEIYRGDATGLLRRVLPLAVLDAPSVVQAIDTASAQALLGTPAASEEEAVGALDVAPASQ